MYTLYDMYKTKHISNHRWKTFQHWSPAKRSSPATEAGPPTSKFVAAHRAAKQQHPSVSAIKKIKYDEMSQKMMNIDVFANAN